MWLLSYWGGATAHAPARFETEKLTAERARLVLTILAVALFSCTMAFIILLGVVGEVSRICEEGLPEPGERPPLLYRIFVEDPRFDEPLPALPERQRPGR